MLRYLFFGGYCRRHRFCLKAFSLIESAIVLGVAGLVIGGIWIAATAINENRAINQAISGILMIDSNLNQSFNGRTTALSTWITTGTSGLMSSMVALSGADGFTIDGKSSVPNSQLLLTYESPGHSRFVFVSSGGWIPASFCIKLISRLTSSGIGNRINYIWTTGTPNKYYANTAFPVIPTKAECTNPTSIDIQFK